MSSYDGTEGSRRRVGRAGDVDMLYLTRADGNEINYFLMEYLTCNLQELLHAVDTIA